MAPVSSIDRVNEDDLELVDPRTLEPHPDNPRRHADETIRQSMRDHGVIDVCVVQRSRRRILGGHGRWENAVAEGAARVPTLWVDCDDDEAEEIMLVLNAAADQATYDKAVLARVMSRIVDSGRSISRAGWDAGSLRRFVARANLKDGDAPKATEDDADVTPPAEPRSRPGDLWLLGGHRVLCGDATSEADVRSVLDGELADMVWTDPPYGVNYVGGSGLTLEGDESTEVAVASFPVLASACRPGAAWWVCSPSGPGLVDFAGELVRLGIYRQQLVWVKDRFVLGRSDFHARHESILYGVTPDEPVTPLLYGWTPGAAHEWIGDRAQDSVLEFPRPTRSAEHPTMKPVPLVGRGIELNTFEGDLVLDGFGGSGSTLIACEQLGRRAVLIEKDPRCVDVIVHRWEQVTNLQAVQA